MASSSRATQFTKLHKVLKKHYKPITAGAERPVLEHLIFACLLENTHYDLAEEMFAAITEEYFDWNEIRVSSVRELTETMARLPDPPAAASHLKCILQHVFEASYSFDLEGLRKKNLGPATDALKKINGTTDFAVSCVVQFALGGHSIPLDAGSLEVMRILGLATEEEVEKHSISGLERAVPKSKGIEFGSLLHQLGADFTANPFSSEVRSKLLEIEPEAKNRWPKRRSTKSAAKTLAAKGESRKKQTTKKTSEGRAKEEPKSGVKKRKKPAGTSKKATAKKKTTKKSTTSIKRKATSSGKKSSNRSVNKKKASDGLSKRKPR